MTESDTRAWRAFASPQTRVMQMICGYWNTQAIHAACELGLADLISDGVVGLEELATATAADQDALRRLLRMLVALGIVRRMDEGYALTDLGACLRSGEPGSLREVAMLHGIEHYRIWGEIMHSLRTGGSAAEEVLGMPLFGYLKHHPQAGARFDAAMSDLSRMAHHAAVATLDFTGVTRVVDVGGGTGSLLAYLLAEVPHLHGVLFDLPHVVERAASNLAPFADRCEVSSGDFFTGGVPQKADMYIMSLILHDYDDESAGRILAAVRRGVPEHARLVLLEQIVPENDRPHSAKFADIDMLVVHGGRERTEREFARLLADNGFRHTGTLPSTTSINAITAVPA